MCHKYTAVCIFFKFDQEHFLSPTEILKSVALIKVMFLSNSNTSDCFCRTNMLLPPLSPITKITPSANKHCKHTGTQVAVRQQL